MPSEAESDERLDALAEEFLARCRSEGPPSISDYARRHPQLASEIERLFPVLLQLEQVSDGLAQHHAVPEQLGDYRLLRQLGQGGMGVVYLAEQLSLRRQVALKLLHPQLQHSESALRRFLVEASSAARLHHPGIVQVHAVGECDGHHFLSMEYVEGRSLQHVLDELRQQRRDAKGLASRLSTTASTGNGHDNHETAAARLCAAVADALQHAHAAGVTHRDVKPSNILLRPDGTAVLSDFGLARDAELPSLTNPGVFAGTPSYASPEQATAGKERPDARSDVFSLGVTLYELLTLRLPFPGSNSTDVLHAIVHDDPVDPRKHNRRVPKDLATIVLTAMQKQPGRRYQTAGAMGDDLRRFLQHEPIVARPASLATRGVKLVRRHRAVAGMLAVLLVAGGATAAWWWSRSTELLFRGAPAGAVAVVDGQESELPARQPLRVSHAEHRVYLRALDPPRISRVTRVQPTRRPLELYLELREVDAIVREIHDRPTSMDPWRNDWPADPLLTHRIAETLRDDFAEGREELLQGVSTAKRLEGMRRLDEAAAATRDLQDLSNRAAALLEQWRGIKQQVEVALRAGNLERLNGALDEVEATSVRIDDALFQPAHRQRLQHHQELCDSLARLGTELTDQASVVRLRARVALALGAEAEPVRQLDERLQNLEREAHIDTLLATARRAAEEGNRDQLLGAQQDLQAIQPGPECAAGVEAWLHAIDQTTRWRQQAEAKLQQAFAGALGAELEQLADASRREREALPPELVASRDALRVLCGQIEQARDFVRGLQQLWQQADIDPAAGLAHVQRLDAASLGTVLADRFAAVLRPRWEQHCFALLQCRNALDACRRGDPAAALRELGLVQDDGSVEVQCWIREARERSRELEQQQRLQLHARLDERFDTLREQLRQDQVEAAELTWKQLQDGWSEEVEWLDTAIEQHASAELLLQRGNLMLWLGRCPDALSDASQALSAENSPAAHRLKGMALFGKYLAQDAHAPEPLREALLEFAAAAQTPALDYWRGMCHWYLGDHEQAASCFDAARSLGMDSADLLIQIADLAYRHSKKAAVQAAPGEANALLAVSMPQVEALCAQAVAAPVSADEVLLARLDATTWPSLRSRIPFLHAATHVSRRDYANALTCWNRAVELDPQDAQTRLERAWSRFWLDQFDAASDDLDQAASLAQGNPEILKGVAELRRRIR